LTLQAKCLNAECPEMDWSSTIGSIQSQSPSTALFSSGPSTGTGSVTAQGNDVSGEVFSCTAPVTVTGAVGQIAEVELDPASALLYTGQTQQFVAKAYDENGNFIRNLENSEVEWSVSNTVGTIDENGLFTAVGVGTTTVTGTYIGGVAEISGTAQVSVSSSPSPPNGGGSRGSGSNNGGGSFRTSTTASVTCAGEPGTVSVTYYESSAPSATVEIYYINGINKQVFSETIDTTTTLSFTPEDQGEYEIRVSLGVDQTNAYFYVPLCTPETLNITQNVTIRLEPVKELVLSKTVDYLGGFTRKFTVYKITDGLVEDYESNVKLFYKHKGNLLDQGTIVDGIPSSVVSKSNMISFEDSPAKVYSEPEVGFEWGIKSIKTGDEIEFAYSFARPLTEQMIESFRAPKIASAGQEQEQGSDLVASLFGLMGLDLSFSLLLIVLFGIVLAFLIYTFIFAKKKEE